MGRRRQQAAPVGVAEALRHGVLELALGEAGAAGGLVRGRRQGDQPRQAGGFLQDLPAGRVGVNVYHDRRIRAARQGRQSRVQVVEERFVRRRQAALAIRAQGNGDDAVEKIGKRLPGGMGGDPPVRLDHPRQGEVEG